MQVLKVGVPDVGSDPSLLRGKLWDGSSLSIVGLHAERGVYGETVSQHLVPTSMCFFSLTQCTKSYLDNCEIFSFFSEEIIPYVAIDCVSMVGGKFGILLCDHLEPELQK